MYKINNPFSAFACHTKAHQPIRYDIRRKEPLRYGSEQTKRKTERLHENDGTCIGHSDNNMSCPCHPRFGNFIGLPSFHILRFFLLRRCMTTVFFGLFRRFEPENLPESRKRCFVFLCHFLRISGTGEIQISVSSGIGPSVMKNFPKSVSPMRTA